MRLMVLFLVACSLQATSHTWGLDGWRLGHHVTNTYGQTAQPTYHSVWLEGTGTATVWLESLDGSYLSTPITMYESMATQTAGDGSVITFPVLGSGEITLTTVESSSIWGSNLQARLMVNATGTINRLMSIGLSHEYHPGMWISVAADCGPMGTLLDDSGDMSGSPSEVPEPSTAGLALLGMTFITISLRKRVKS